MCAPAVVAGVVVAGGAVQMYSQWRSAQTQAAAEKANAQALGYQINDATQQGGYDAKRIENQGAATAASARTSIAANGIDSTSGSAADVITSSNANAAVDAARVKSNAARAVWGLKTEQAASLSRAKQAKAAGYLGMLGTGLEGASRAAGAYADAGGKFGPSAPAPAQSYNL